MRKSIHLFGASFILAGCLPGAATAETAGLSQLLGQAKYWQGRGRGDLARQAYSRALAIDPANREARTGLSGAAPAARPAPAPAAKGVGATPRRPVDMVRAQPPRAPAPRTVIDRGGAARAAGFRALDAGQIDVAATRFRTALAADPSDADANGGLGLVRLRASRFGEARDLLMRASSLGSPAKWAEALDAARFYAGMDAARSALAGGRVEEAERLARALAGSGFADRGAAGALLAGIYEQQGRYAEAATLYADLGKAGRAVGGAAGNAIRNQARAALDGGDPVTAERLLREGMATAPDDPWLSYELANLLIRQGRPAEADTLIRSLAYSNDPQPLYAAALILNQSGRTTDATAVMTRIAPGQRTQEMRDFAAGLDVVATIRQARELAARGAQGQALATLRQAADVRGLSVDRVGALAQALLDLGDPVGAEQLSRTALTAPATGAASYDAVVRVLARTGQDGLALAAVGKAEKLAGSSPTDRNGLSGLHATLAVSQAERLRQAGQFASAFDTLQAGWNAAPGNVEIVTALARLYQAGGLNEQAVQAYRMALVEHPAEKDLMIGLIDAASATGDFRIARAAADQAIRAHPEDHEVYMAASRMAQARGDYGQAVKYLKTARALYLQKNGGASALASGNPFAGGEQPANPFRAMPSAQPANPFAPAMGGGARESAAFLPLAAAGGRGMMPMASPAAYAAPDTRQDFLRPSVRQGGMPGMVADAYPAYGAQPAVSGDYGDPTLAAIDRALAQRREDSGPRVDVDTGFRSRTGETGLSRLSEINGSAKISAPFAHGRVGVTARAVSLDSGRPTGSGLARFGTDATPEALAIVAKTASQLAQADTQHASGVALSASYESDLLKLSAGTTPLGFAKSHIAGHAEITPRLSAHSTARIWAEREPVTDSIISYAGTSDPRTGLQWGAVMRSGGGLSLSYDKDGNGVYADAAYHHYDGTAVRDNEGVEANVGGYLRAWQDGASGVSVGFNANFQTFRNNQNYFTYGHGGYFSPQSFISVNFPVRYWIEKGALKVNANVAPGYQSYDQQSEALYPTEGGAQGVLEYLKGQNGDVRARYDSASKTGFGLSAGASAYYSLAPNTRVGGDLSLNTFGDYKEFKTLIGIRQQIGGQ